MIKETRKHKFDKKGYLGEWKRRDVLRNILVPEDREYNQIIIYYIEDALVVKAAKFCVNKMLTKDGKIIVRVSTNYYTAFSYNQR